MRIFKNYNPETGGGKGHLKIVNITNFAIEPYVSSLDLKIELVNPKSDLDQKTLDEVVIPRIIKAILKDTND